MKTAPERQKAREIADRLQAEQQDQEGPFTDWFEKLYAQAAGRAELIPWGDEKPHPALLRWLAGHSSSRRGRAIDVGCGLGDNAACLADAGYEVTAIDLSASAINWARQRFGDRNISFRVVDLFKLPDDLRGRFDLVHETYTLQALPKELGSGLFSPVAALVSPGGRLLVTTRSRPEEQAADGPPWPLARSELERFVELGLEEVSLMEFIEEKPDGRRIAHIQAEYKKPC